MRYTNPRKADIICVVRKESETHALMAPVLPSITKKQQILSLGLMQPTRAREFAVQRKRCQAIGIRKTCTWRSSHYTGINTLWHWTPFRAAIQIFQFGRWGRKGIMCYAGGKKKYSNKTLHFNRAAKKNKKGLRHHFPHMPKCWAWRWLGHTQSF